MKTVGTEPKTSSEYTAFKSLLRRVLTVPREEIKRREAEYQRQSKLSPNRRGPKPKPEPAGPDSAA
jgi:hypothetical protein